MLQCKWGYVLLGFHLQNRHIGVRFSYRVVDHVRLYIRSSPSPRASPGGLKYNFKIPSFRALRRAGASWSHSPRRGIPTCKRSRTPGPFSSSLFLPSFEHFRVGASRSDPPGGDSRRNEGTRTPDPHHFSLGDQTFSGGRVVVLADLGLRL